MPHPGGHEIGSGTNPPPPGETAADAIEPKDRTIPELAELADSPEGRRIEQKLRAEALARRRGEDEDAAVEDPTGHA